MKFCRVCAKQLGSRNATGLCNPCFNRDRASDPAHRAKQRAGIKRKIAHDPAFLASLRERARAQGRREDTRKARSERFSRDRVWEIGAAAALAPEARAKAARSISATRMAWCPPELISAYRDLTKLGYRAPEARRLILDQHERDMARFTAKVGKAAALREGVEYEAPASEPELPDCPVEAAAVIFGIEPADIVGTNRAAKFVDARAVLSVVLREQGETYPSIGRRINRDHTSILHLVETFEQRSRRNPALARAVERLAA